MTPEFKSYPSISRLSRDVVVTEKLDGSNAQVHIYTEDSELKIIAGSRNRWLTAEQDNFGFAKWVENNKDQLLTLGEGTHFGEWWGSGIQVGYGLAEKRFSLFNTGLWNDANTPDCCHVVPILHEGEFDMAVIDGILQGLKESGSVAAPGFMKPEGVVVYHKHSNTMFKKTIKNDEAGKSYGS